MGLKGGVLAGAVILTGAVALIYAGVYPAWLLTVLIAAILYLCCRNYFGRLRDHKLHMEQMAQLHMRTIETLALAIEAKDRNTHDHLCRVRVYASELGKELNLDEKEMEALRAAALLHDIGKLAVPEHIINKPGKLTPEEFERMKIHPIVGAEILKRVNFPYPVAPIVRSHHERWDGKGYPDGLAGEQIPIGARILTAVDCLDALASDRPYRRALSLEDAMAHVSRLSGSQFDPRVVRVLERRCAELEALARRQGAAGESLHLGVQVRRGDQPGAGFEQNGFEHNGAVQPAKLPSVTVPDRDLLVASCKQDALERLVQPLESSLSLEDALSRFAEALKELIAFDSVCVYMRSNDRLLPKFVMGEDKALFASLKIPLGEGLSGWVAQNRRPIINGNPSVEPGYLNDPARYPQLRSALAVPLENSHNEVLGVIVLYARAADAFRSLDLAILQQLSPRISRSIQNAIHYHMAESQNTTDLLTKTLAARAFFERLETTLTRHAVAGSPLSLVVCDLDAFWEVNKTFGHVEGNAFLARLADRFREAIREDDLLGRLGGDEFALAFPNLSARTAEVRLRDLRAAVRQTSLDLFGDRHLVTASLALATAPEDGRTGKELVAAADARIQQVKRASRQRLEGRVAAPSIVARA